jgi:hypothetical protein
MTDTPTLITNRVRAWSRLAARWVARQAETNHASLDQGLAITPGEVEFLLLDPAEADAQQHCSMLNDPQAAALLAMAQRDDATLQADAIWSGMLRAFALTPPEADLLCLAVALELEPQLHRVVAYLQDDVRAIAPTAAFAARLFHNNAALPIGLDNLLRWRLVQPVDSVSAWRASTAFQVDPAVALSVAAGTWRDPLLDGAVTLIPQAVASQLPAVRQKELAALCGFTGEGEVAFVGPEGSGRQTLAAQYAAALDRPLLAIDTRALPTASGSHEGALIAAQRMAHATGALPYWRDGETIPAADWSRLCRLTPLTLRGERQAPANATFAVELRPLSAAQRTQVWGHYSAAPPPEVIVTNQLTPGEIALVARAMQRDPAGGMDGIRDALRRAMPVQNDLLQRLPCPYDWDDLVVPADLLRQLQDFENQVRLRWDVYENWGFQRLTHLGNGISALFGGPSGTGKTMAAQVLARSLGLDLYRVDLAGVVNKYVGETEKRLRDVFDACERVGALLFFDEADALFGSRMQVKDSHDRFANIEIDYLLQRIERFDGIAILATNRKSDLDAAFLRRLRFVVDFLMPAPAERLALWQRALLPASPAGEPILDGIDWDFLSARLELTGAQIKAIALGAAFLARSEERLIGMRHVIAATQREMTKNGSMLRLPLQQVAR